jgi:hypothetical protein
MHSRALRDRLLPRRPRFWTEGRYAICENSIKTAKTENRFPPISFLLLIRREYIYIEYKSGRKEAPQAHLFPQVRAPRSCQQ